jgi:hypothetical protein
MTVVNQDDPQRDIDEIQNFLDARYVSACEALWRLFQFDLQCHSQTIVRLQVHLEGEHLVRFSEGFNIQQAADESRSQLLEWFKLNRMDIGGNGSRRFTYVEIPKHYTWTKCLRPTWKERVREGPGSNVITRLYFVHPKERERFCLRILLLHVKGAQSFQDIRTFDGVICPTFREAAMARSLMEDDKEWHQCLQEAAMFQMASSLRHLFALILVHCSPSDPLRLWTSFSRDFSGDFLYRLRLAQHGVDMDVCPMSVDDTDVQEIEDPDIRDQELIERAKRDALFDINGILKGIGSRLSDFPELPQDMEDMSVAPEDVVSPEQLEARAQKNIEDFNEGQYKAFNDICGSITGNYNVKKRLFFVDGPGDGQDLPVQHSDRLCRRTFQKEDHGCGFFRYSCLDLTWGQHRSLHFQDPNSYCKRLLLQHLTSRKARRPYSRSHNSDLG